MRPYCFVVVLLYISLLFYCCIHSGICHYLCAGHPEVLEFSNFNLKDIVTPIKVNVYEALEASWV